MSLAQEQDWAAMKSARRSAKAEWVKSISHGTWKSEVMSLLRFFHQHSLPTEIACSGSSKKPVLPEH